MRVGLVTCVDLPEHDPDQELLVGALRARGVDAQLLAWDDPQASPEDCDACVLRSAWNYYEDPDAFLAWVARAAQSTRLFNPESAVRRNLHKGYLLELEANGVAIVPTALVPHGKTVDLGRLLTERGWSDVVVKPAVSASSYRTRRFVGGERQAAGRFLDDLCRERDALVQPYLPSVEVDGERALVWIDGVFTHAIEKRPRFADGEERVSAALAPTPEELRFGAEVLRHVREPLLYARVDLMRDAEGRPRLSELELVEPSLFLQQCPAALERLVDAILRRAD